MRKQNCEWKPPQKQSKIQTRSIYSTLVFWRKYCHDLTVLYISERMYELKIQLTLLTDRGRIRTDACLVIWNLGLPRNDYLLKPMRFFLYLESPRLKLWAGSMKQNSGMFTSAVTLFKCHLANLGILHPKPIVAFGGFFI